MEIVQGVLIRVRTEGAESAEQVAKSLDRLKAAGENATGGIGKATTAAKGMREGFESAVSSGLNPAVASLGKLAGVIIPVGIGIGIAAIAKGALNAADELHKLSMRTGITVEDLSRLSYAARLSDTSMQSVTTGMRGLSNAVDDAAKGNVNLRESFRAVGVGLDDLKTKTPKDLFLQIATGLAAIEDPATRVARANDLLGRSGQSLLPLMEDLAGDGFAKLADEAERMGLVISTETAAAADEFNDNLERMKLSLQGGANAVVEDLAPALAALSGQFESSSSSLLGWLNPLNIVSEAIKGMTALVIAQIGVLRTFSSVAGGLLDAYISAEQTYGRTGSLRDAYGAFGRGVNGAFQIGAEQGRQTTDSLYGMFFRDGAAGSAAGVTNRDVKPDEMGPFLSPAQRAAIKEREAAEKRISDLAERTAQQRERELETMRSISTESSRQARDAFLRNDYQQKLNRLSDQEADALREVSRLTHLTARERADLVLQIENAYAKEKVMAFFEEDKKGWEARQKTITDQADLWMETLKKNGLGVAQALSDSNSIARSVAAVEAAFRAQPFVNALSDAFTDAATTGGKNLGEIAGGIFNQTVSHGFDLLFSQLLGGPMKGNEALGQDPNLFYSPGGNVLTPEQADAMRIRSDRARAGIAAASIATTGYAMGSQPGGQTASTLGGAMSGASIGATWGGAAFNVAGAAIGAIAGAVVGFVSAYMGAAASRDEYKYGVPYIDDRGQAGFSGARNMQPAEIQKAIASAQETFDAVRNTFVNILLQFPNQIIPELEAINGKFQDNPSKHFLKHLDEWLTQTLPREIAADFREGMEAAFTGEGGLSSVRFNDLWRELDAMDPKKALQYLTDLAAGITSWNRAINNLGAAQGMMGDHGLVTGDYQFREGGRREAGESTFIGSVRTGAEGLFQIARQLVNLTGQDQVAAWRAMGAGVEALTRSLQDFLTQVGDAIASTRQTLDDERLGKEIARAPDIETQAALLNREWIRIQDQIRNAAALGLSPQDIEGLVGRGVNILNQIYELDPSEEVYGWWQRQIDTLQNISTSALEQIGQNAIDAVTEVLTGLEPFREWFLGLPVTIDPAMGAFVGSIDGARIALDELGRAVRDATPVGGGGSGGGGTGGDGGGGTGGDNRNNDANADGAKSITVNMNAPVYGVRDLQAQIIAAVKAAAQKTPSSFEAAF